MEATGNFTVNQDPVRVLPIIIPERETATEIDKSQTHRRISLRNAFALAGVAFVASSAQGLKNSIPAEANPQAPISAAELPSSVRATFRTETATASAAVSDFARGKAKILANISTKPMPKSWVAKQRSRGNCVTVGKGTAYPWVKTQGYNVKNRSEYGWDNRRSLVCNGIRTACRNRSIIPRFVPFERPKTYFVKKWKANVSIKAEAKAVATCNMPGSFAYAEGSGKASVRVRLKTFAKTRGNVAMRAYSRAFARAEARAKAKVICSSQENVVVVPKPVEQPPSEEQQNLPPTGRGDVPHRYVNTVDKVCVDPSDPNGDPVSVSNFQFKNAQTGLATGEIQSAVFTLQNSDVQCVWWKAPSTPQSVIWSADLNDGRGGRATHIDEVPVLASDTGGA